MPEWMFGGLVTLGVGVIGTVGIVVGHLVSNRASRRSDSQALIDQLQEELTGYRTAAEARATAQDERMNRLERYSDGYRDHAHELRSHIWDQKPPPPPQWPEGLPK